MLHHFITLLPFSFAVVYMIEYVAKKDKTETQIFLLWMTILSTFFLFFDALYVTKGMSDMKVFVITDTVNHFITPVVPLIVFLMLYSYRHKREEYMKYLAACSIALFYGTACLSLTLVIGLDNVATFLESYYEHQTYLPEYDTFIYHFWVFLYMPFYYVMVGVELVLVIIYILYYLRKKRFGFVRLGEFLFKGSEATPLIIHCWISLAFFLVMFIRMGLGAFFWMQHPIASSCMSLMIAFLIYAYGNIGLISHMYEGTLREMLHPLSSPELYEGKYAAEVLESNNMIEDEDDITDQIIELMEGQQLYKNPNLTIEDLANKMNITTVLLTAVLERRMGCTFREYTNKMRLLQAQRYMLLHPNETQERIASACGFTDASSFSKKFRQFTSQTPREWLATHRTV